MKRIKSSSRTRNGSLADEEGTMVQQAFNAAINAVTTILAAKFVLNDVPHAFLDSLV